jgi:hypothetical protein
LRTATMRSSSSDGRRKGTYLLEERKFRGL